MNKERNKNIGVPPYTVRDVLRAYAYGLGFGILITVSVYTLVTHW